MFPCQLLQHSVSGCSSFEALHCFVPKQINDDVSKTRPWTGREFISNLNRDNMKWKETFSLNYNIVYICIYMHHVLMHKCCMKKGLLSLGLCIKNIFALRCLNPNRDVNKGLNWNVIPFPLNYFFYTESKILKAAQKEACLFKLETTT